MFLQSGSGIDAGSVFLAPTLNCSFFNSAIDMRNGSANRFARKVFCRKNRGTAGWPCPNFLVRLQLRLERARRKRPNRKHVAAAGAGVR
jgi:hypothetical protein